jgi:hypothetical protein
MTFIYYIDGEKFTTNDNWYKVAKYNVSSPNENIPAIEDLNSEYKIWYLKGQICHRLTGPALIHTGGNKEFWLNGEYYDNVKYWLKDHTNPDLYFDALGMDETDKVLWFLQN